MPTAVVTVREDQPGTAGVRRFGDGSNQLTVEAIQDGRVIIRAGHKQDL